MNDSERTFVGPEDLPPTEQLHPSGSDLHRSSPDEFLACLEADDGAVHAALVAARPAIRALATRAAETLSQGGRLITVGAGTSGRLAALDAAEWEPTFGVPRARLLTIVAGGRAALESAVEGAEDDGPAGRAALVEVGLQTRDLVVGITASGGARFVNEALDEARAQGAARALITCNEAAAAGPGADAQLLRVVLRTGPEILAGSTRLKAAIATHLVLQRVSTLCAQMSGWIHAGRMVEMRPTNRKLRARAARIVAELGQVPAAQATALLAAAGDDLKVAIVSGRLGIALPEARRRLEEVGRRLDRLPQWAPPSADAQAPEPVRSRSRGAPVPVSPMPVSPLAHFRRPGVPWRAHWLGLMSGTSCDGIDVARVALEETAAGTVRMHECTGFTRPFPDDVARQLRACLVRDDPVSQAARWDRWLGDLFAEAALEGVQTLGRVDLVALSGHTFSHLPEAVPPTTLQLGNPAVVAERLGLPVVAGFRATDVARGGEGAPLVPAADRILFADPHHEVWVLNLGGIANLTRLPAGGGNPRAADCGPSNLLLDACVRQATDGAEPWDQDGVRAAAGCVHEDRLAAWLHHPFFLQGRRSTGRESFGESWLIDHASELRGLSLSDTLATLVHWIACSVERCAVRLGAAGPPARLLVGGGGAHNRALMAALGARLRCVPQVLARDRHGVDADLREAAAFAILGHEFWMGRAGSFPETTGCRFAGVLGSLWWPTRVTCP